MIEEPYRWVEAIANRREYIEGQLAPVVPSRRWVIAKAFCLSRLVRRARNFSRFTIGSQWEGLGILAISSGCEWPRLNWPAPKASPARLADVSLRRLAHYSLSPVLKSAFEQIYGPPYLARMLFAEVGARPEDDLFLRVEYDGEIASNGATYARARQDFAVLSGTRQSVEMMEAFLKSEHKPDASFETTVNSALDAWSVGHMLLQASEAKELPARDAIAQHRQEQLAAAAIEAAVLERDSSRPIRYRSLADKELRSIISR